MCNGFNADFKSSEPLRPTTLVMLCYANWTETANMSFATPRHRSTFGVSQCHRNVQSVRYGICLAVFQSIINLSFYTLICMAACLYAFSLTPSLFLFFSIYLLLSPPSLCLCIFPPVWIIFMPVCLSVCKSMCPCFAPFQLLQFFI